VWAYCLMPNHVHLVLVPSDPDGLRAALSEAHRRYTRLINERKGWTGYLWQGRFASVAMDESHLMACVRYVEQNPVRAKLVTRARDWPWSSAGAHLAARDDGLVRVKPCLSMSTIGVRFWAKNSAVANLKPSARASERGGHSPRPHSSSRSRSVWAANSPSKNPAPSRSNTGVWADGDKYSVPLISVRSRTPGPSLRPAFCWPLPEPRQASRQHRQ